MSLLLDQLTLTISRDAAEGYWLDGEWQAPAGDDPFDINCSIQPFGTKGESRLILPAGLTSSDAQVVFTRTLIRTVSQFSQDEADTTIIDGNEYIAFQVKNWARHSALMIAHYEVLFVRKDKDKGGGI